ncbi:MAG: dipeptidyl aminopeptidase, partial [Bacteroidota bacterium]|nr:dipeptidyl aminopeptidase [Bacteroidota bacterium]
MQDDTAFEHSQPPIFENPAFEFKLLRQLGLMTYGGATFGECFGVALTMNEWDLKAWVASWDALARDVERQGDIALEHGHVVSAKESYLRATNYHHAAEYYSLIAGGNYREYGMRSADCFEKAIPLLTHHAEVLSIQADSHTYPCYFFSPDDSGIPRPTVLLVSGVESCGEEQYFYGAISALRRGYSALVFQGPG